VSDSICLTETFEKKTLGEIEVVELRGATYFEGDIHAEAQRLATVDAARFMPYAFQNIDDYTAIE
jgi:hypothetical protein